MKTSRLRLIILGILIALLLVMPYATFLLQLLRFGFAESGYPLPALVIKATVGWKEILLLGGLGLAAAVWVQERKFPFTITKLDFLLFIFMLFGVVWGAQRAPSASDVVFGFRYDFAVFLFYFLARVAIVSREQLLAIFKKIAWWALPVFVFGIAQTLFLPHNLLEHVGYSHEVQVTGNPLPPTHLLLNKIVRAMSTFPGPNSLAMYAVFVFLMLLYVGKNWLSRSNYYLLGIITFVALICTFSRGHVISLVAGLVIVGLYSYFSAPGRAFHNRPTNAAHYFTIGTLAVLIAALAGTMYFGSRQTENSPGTLSFILHSDSTAIHRDVRLKAWEVIQKNPMGTGLGTSGLATTNTGGEIFNPESWYVQITQELGWIGLLGAISVLAGVFGVLAKLLHDLSDPQDRGIVLFLATGFIAIAVSANFLPSWFEVASISWWIIFGLYLTDYVRTFPRSDLLLNDQRKNKSGKVTVARTTRRA